MPTAHPRVQVTVDPELGEALRQAAAQLQVRGGQAALVRELALRGARELLAGRQEARRALRFLAEQDFSALRDVDAERRERLP